ncbi:hypothetical protein FAS33_24170 [Salmonella enterica subsp. enterica serovar Newport]|nr:hypothetical protein [Salmonella enterica subsp. enterica serovar Teko]ECD7340082.1 hypothetical protein [Salmonella enterica subsp. enterica serovar Newport]EHE7851596.1 hypothetical protein [Salmonella enterica subsp. enterica serovar Teko]
MRPATFEPEQIIEAGRALQAEGRNITGFALRNRIGGGNPTRLRQIWDEYQASQHAAESLPVTELPAEIAEEVKAVSTALAERLTHLVTKLNDKAVRAAEYRVTEITRTAAEQAAQAEQEFADAARTVECLEGKLDELQAGNEQLTQTLREERLLHRQQEVELARLKERLVAAEQTARQNEERYQEQKTTLQEALDTEQQQLKSMREDLLKRLEQASAEANEHAEELKSERDKVNTLLSRLETRENALAQERQHHQATRDTLQQQLEQVGADLHDRTSEIAIERDRVSTLTSRLESQEKTSILQQQRMEREIEKLADRCTQLEKQRDDALLEVTKEKEAIAALRGETDALQRQNQSLMAALAGNKQTGGQNA